MKGRAPEILCSRVTTSFDDEIVLSQLNLTVPAGKITCLLGPSGCGKTTLLKHILGLLRPDAGNVHVGHFDVGNSSPRVLTEMYKSVSALHSGTWIYAASLYSSLSVRENLLAVIRQKEKELAVLEGRGRGNDIADPDLGLWVPGSKLAVPRTPSEQDLSERVEDYLRRFGLLEVADLLPERMAARTMRRAAVARSLVVDAALYILDDPDTAADAPNSGEIIGAILDTYERTGATMLIATHDLNLAELVSDHVAVLARGRIVTQGDPRQVLDGVDGWYRFDEQFPQADSYDARAMFGGATPIQRQGDDVFRSSGAAGPDHSDRARFQLPVLLTVAMIVILALLGALLLRP